MSAEPDQTFRLVTILTATVLAAFVVVPAHAQHPTAVTSIVNSNADTTLEVNYNGSLLMPGTLIRDGTAKDSIPAEGAGVRMMWYPAKAAFRAGRVGFQKDGTQWDASNLARGSVAFGTDTKASGPSASAMGYKTTASAVQATAMGLETTASGSRATAMGNGATASGENATAMGDNTTASSLDATAMGFETTASGSASTAMGGSSTASGGAATAMGAGTTASGKGATAMGHSTIAATDYSLSIGEYNDANRDPDGDGVSDNTLFVVGNGDNTNPPSSRSDALVLKGDGDFGLSTSSPVAHLHVQESVKESGATNLGRHAGVVENTSTESGADVFALKTALNDPGTITNFISFLDADEQIGTIQGNGNGGIEITGTSADYAEELPVQEGAPKPEAGELVGVRGGEASLRVEGADRVMIASEAPIMTGNATPATSADDDERVAVAFVGQVPAKVRGTADVGDLIVASSENDGTGRAVAPSAYKRAKHGPIAGQAWSAKASEKVGEVTVAVGLGRSGAVAEQLKAQRKTNQRQEAQIEDLKNRLAALEEERSSSVVAGLTGSGTDLLLAFLLGGLLGAGLIWRRQG
jgi:hypothetical protein